VLTEPFRLFFLSGTLWSVVGVLLWPLFHAGYLDGYPSIVHARIMIQAFGGAFVVGFLGTAGPRMATAPRLTSAELWTLFALHSANGLLLLAWQTRAADACFLALLVMLLACLVVRVVRFREGAPPPQMLLTVSGLACGIVGTTMWLLPALVATPERYRLAGLLVYQGLLLLPALGIGSFIFPRMLGRSLANPGTGPARRRTLLRAAAVVALIVASFVVETAGYVTAGYLVRGGVAAGYLLLEVRWRRRPDEPARGSVANGLFWALGMGLAGLMAPAFTDRHPVALEHLLYVGGFGLLMLMVGSRVLFGHSGEIARFTQRSWMARSLIGLAALAATTRASADFMPAITMTHHVYAAVTWAVLVALWLAWHRRRFVTQGEE
jgi:uncharacterized protein involved in response to NO